MPSVLRLSDVFLEFYLTEVRKIIILLSVFCLVRETKHFSEIDRRRFSNGFDLRAATKNLRTLELWQPRGVMVVDLDLCHAYFCSVHQHIYWRNLNSKPLR